jgi:hypothetical protein
LNVVRRSHGFNAPQTHSQAITQPRKPNNHKATILSQFTPTKSHENGIGALARLEAMDL